MNNLNNIVQGLMTEDDLEQIQKQVMALSDEEKKELASKIVQAVSGVAFDLVAQQKIAEMQGRNMITEDEMSKIIQSNISSVSSEGSKIGH